MPLFFHEYAPFHKRCIANDVLAWTSCWKTGEFVFSSSLIKLERDHSFCTYAKFSEKLTAR